MLRMQEMAYPGFKFPGPPFMCGMLATQVAFSYSYPPPIYYLTETSLFKNPPPPPPMGKSLKKALTSIPKKNLLNIYLHIKFILLTTPHVVNTCDSVKWAQIKLYISIYNEIHSNQFGQKIVCRRKQARKNCLQQQQHQKKIVCVDEMSTPPPLQKNNGPSLRYCTTAGH